MGRLARAGSAGPAAAPLPPRATRVTNSSPSASTATAPSQPITLQAFADQYLQDRLDAARGADRRADGVQRLGQTHALGALAYMRALSEASETDDASLAAKSICAVGEGDCDDRAS